MGKNKTPLPIFTERIDTCRDCPQKVQRMLGAYCDMCGCIIKKKAARLNQKCPLGKWKS